MKGFRFLLMAAALLLSGCPGDKFTPRRSKTQACQELDHLVVSNNHRTLTMAPGETLPTIPLQGPGGFVNDPSLNSNIPLTAKFYGLGGVVVSKPQPTEGMAQPPFTASIGPEGITVGAQDPQNGERDKIEQNVSFLVEDKCAAIMNDPSRVVRINLKLIMDPSRKPLTEDEKLAQMRPIRSAAGGSGTLANAEPVGASAGGSSGSSPGTVSPDNSAQFVPHKQSADAAPAGE